MLILASSADDRVISAMIWFGVLLGFVVLAVVGYLLMRRYFFGKQEDSSSSPLSLQELDDLRSRGAISEQEYQVLRRTVVDRFLQAGDR